MAESNGNKSRMPHIQLPEDLGIEYAVLPGDPARVDRVAACLEQAEFLVFNREYKSVKGLYHGIPVLVMSTGMGGPSTAIAVEELHRIGVKAAVRIGSCGALLPDIHLGDLVFAKGAVRDEGTSLGYAPLSYPAVPDFGLLMALQSSARELGIPWHMGIVRSHDCLYRDENPEIYENWAKKGVAASDMETAALCGGRHPRYADSFCAECSILQRRRCKPGHRAVCFRHEYYSRRRRTRDSYSVRGA